MTEIEIKSPVLKMGFGTLELTVDIEPSYKEVAEEFVLGIKPDKKYVAVLKEKKDRRTLSQNSYYWALNNQLALNRRISPVEVYIEHIKHMAGIFDYLIVKEEAVESFIKNWGRNGLAWLAFDCGAKEKYGGAHLVKAYRGSSDFDTEEMSRLIDLLIMDCESVGIPTMTKEEIERLPIND